MVLYRSSGYNDVLSRIPSSYLVRGFPNLRLDKHTVGNAIMDAQRECKKNEEMFRIDCSWSSFYWQSFFHEKLFSLYFLARRWSFANEGYREEAIWLCQFAVFMKKQCKNFNLQLFSTSTSDLYAKISVLTHTHTHTRKLTQGGSFARGFSMLRNVLNMFS